MCGWSRLTSETITRMWSLRTSVQRTFQLYPSPVFVFRLNSCIVLDVSRVYLPNTVLPPIKKKVQYYYVAYWATSEMAMAYCVHAQRGLFCQDFWAAGGRDALFFPLVCARDVCTEVMCKREHVLNSSPKLDSKTSSSPPELPCLLVAASGEPPQSDTVLTPDDE